MGLPFPHQLFGIHSYVNAKFIVFFCYEIGADVATATQKWCSLLYIWNMSVVVNHLVQRLYINWLKRNRFHVPIGFEPSTPARMGHVL